MLQLPTQVYMACLFAILDILLNVQHCWYVYWVVPRRKKRELEQRAAPAVAKPCETANDQQLTQQSLPEPLVKPQAVVTPDEEDMQRTSDAVQSEGTAMTDNPVTRIPAAHHLRALSAGRLISGMAYTPQAILTC